MKRKQNKRLTVLISVLILLLFVFFIYSQVSKSPPNKLNNYQIELPANNDRWYHSSLLKFSVLVPAGYRIEDKMSSVILEKNGKKIIIDRNGNNYQTLEEYLENSDSKLDLKIEQENHFILNGLKSIERIEYFIKGPINRHKIYFISKNSAIYNISTNTETLFSDLDRIAQSFYYIP